MRIKVFNRSLNSTFHKHNYTPIFYLYIIYNNISYIKSQDLETTQISQQQKSGLRNSGIVTQWNITQLQERRKSCYMDGTWQVESIRRKGRKTTWSISSEKYKQSKAISSDQWWLSLRVIKPRELSLPRGDRMARDLERWWCSVRGVLLELCMDEPP